MLHHEGNTQRVCRSIQRRMSRHWNIYEKSMLQHAIANVAACVEGRLLVVNIRKMDAGSMPQHVRHTQAGCRGIQGSMPRHPIKIFSVRMMNAAACEIECRDIGPVTQKNKKI